MLARILNWNSPGEPPAILTVVTPVSHLDLVLLSFAQALGPLLGTCLIVVRMQDETRPVARFLRGRQAGVRVTAIVGKRYRAVWRIRPYDHLHLIGDMPETLVAGTERCFPRLNFVYGRT